jgi:hypothetical protein
MGRQMKDLRRAAAAVAPVAQPAALSTVPPDQQPFDIKQKVSQRRRELRGANKP